MNTNAPHSQPSYPAKAGYPVFRDVTDGNERLRRTGYPAGPCHRARRRRDPVAEYDDLCESDATLNSDAVIPRCAIAHRGWRVGARPQRPRPPDLALTHSHPGA